MYLFASSSRYICNCNINLAATRIFFLFLYSFDLIEIKRAEYLFEVLKALFCKNLSSFSHNNNFADFEKLKNNLYFLVNLLIFSNINLHFKIDFSKNVVFVQNMFP